MVLLMISFVAMVPMTMAFGGWARDEAVAGSARCLGDLTASSVLAEYDRDLWSRYQLLGYYGTEGRTADRIAYYLGSSWEGKDYIDWEVSQVSLYPYPLTDRDNLMEQIRIQGLLDTGEDLLQEDTPQVHTWREDPRPERVLQDSATLAGLPTARTGVGGGIADYVDLLGNLSSFSDVVEEGSDAFWTCQYIQAHFPNTLDDKGLGETFFRGEMEYILCGHPSDEDNREGAQSRILAVREVLNLLYLEQTPSKTILIDVAFAWLPPPAAFLAKQATIAVWAYLESLNDYNVLITGGVVPLMKDEDSWAVDVESALTNTNPAYIDTGNQSGYGYEDYLTLLLYLMDGNTRLTRMMDVIQINMRYLYNGWFLLSERMCGVQYVIRVNGKEYFFADAY